MKFTLTSFDVFDEGWVKTVFEVEAESQEVGEMLIKKQLSKLFRSFPAGQLVLGWHQTNDGNWAGTFPGIPISIPNMAGVASGGFVVPTITNPHGQGNVVFTPGPHLTGINDMVLWSSDQPLQPDESMVFVGNGTASFTVTNNCTSPFTVNIVNATEGYQQHNQFSNLSFIPFSNNYK